MYKHQLAQELKTVLTSTLIIYVCLLNLLLLPPVSVIYNV